MIRLEAEWLQSDAAQTVCAMLEDAGYQAWFVGGCIRNALVDKPVNDLDISTDALPDIVMSLARECGLHAVPTGIDHGTVTVVAEGMPFEITTFRKDILTNGRQAVVQFSTSMVDDAARRDFTMNALYASPRGEVVDPLDGIDDLRSRRVRFIGDADARIEEDYLRILRFFRFYAHFGNPDEGIDADGLAACATHVEGIPKLSKERIGQEMLKLLVAVDPAPALAAMASCGALHQVLPGANGGQMAVLVHIEDQAGLSPDALRRLALLGGADVTEMLRLSRHDSKRLQILQTATASPGELGFRHGASLAKDILAISCALSEKPWDQGAAAAAEFGAGQVFPVKAADLPNHLSGPEIGVALKQAETAWIASGFKMSKAELLA